MSVININNEPLAIVYNMAETELDVAYNISGVIIYEKGAGVLPVPTGNLTANQKINLPDLYEAGKGFTCTGLSYDLINNCFLVGDIGILKPNSGTIRSQIIKMSADFSSVLGTIPLYERFPSMADVQGITIDTRNNTIWFCSPGENKIRNITQQNNPLAEINITQPTGIAFDRRDSSLWVLNYQNKILHVDRYGNIIQSVDFAYNEALDQCFFDPGRGYLYITAGNNYNSRNNIYLYNTISGEQSIVCTVDSYSVEGLWIGEDKMVIVNDGYYHSAAEPYNTADIYDLT